MLQTATKGKVSCSLFHCSSRDRSLGPCAPTPKWLFPKLTCVMTVEKFVCYLRRKEETLALWVNVKDHRDRCEKPKRRGQGVENSQHLEGHARLHDGHVEKEERASLGLNPSAHITPPASLFQHPGWQFLLASKCRNTRIRSPLGQLDN